MAFLNLQVLKFLLVSSRFQVPSKPDTWFWDPTLQEDQDHDSTSISMLSTATHSLLYRYTPVQKAPLAYYRNAPDIRQRQKLCGTGDPTYPNFMLQFSGMGSRKSEIRGKKLMSGCRGEVPAGGLRATPPDAKGFLLFVL